MASINVDIDIEVVCGDCGASLDAVYKRGELVVDPCTTCLAEAETRGTLDQ